MALKIPSSPVLESGLVFMSPVEIINTISSGRSTKEMQSYMVIELNLNISESSRKSSVAIS